MKKKIKVVAIVLLLLLVIGLTILAVMYINGAFSQELSDGKYYIVGNTEYKDAYVEVKDDQIQFHNIDLTAIYREQLAKDFRKIIKNHPEKDLPDEELYELLDVNKWLVDKSYTMRYDPKNPHEYETFVYVHHLIGPNFEVVKDVMVLHYNSLKKTITIMRDGIEIEFKRK